MAGMDLVRWRRNRDVVPIVGAGVAPPMPMQSAAGRSDLRRSMTGSATVLDIGDRRQAMKARSARQGWQQEAFAYLDGVGELRYVVQTSANAISRLRFFPGMTVDPKEPPVPLDEVGSSDMPSSVVDAAYEDMDVLNEPGHGLSGMIHTQSINKQLVGEYYVVGLPVDPDTGEESWTIRSIDEVIVDTDGRYYLRDRPPGFQGYDEPPMLLSADCYVARCWDSHPRFRALAWCQMRPLLESLEELMLASRMIRASLRSRIAGAGILLVPDELELLGIDPSNQDAQANPFFEELAKAMLTPIQSEGDASEVVPMVVKGPADVLKELRHLTLDRPIDQHAMAVRGELIRRIAVGVDWPPELLLGIGDVSHWAQWFVDESTFRYHYEPQGISAVRHWTQGFAQPMLLARDFDPATEEKARQVVWWYDPTQLLTHPDRTKDAVQLHTMDVLNDDALLRAAGFDPDTDKPSESDFLVRLMSKFRTFPPNVVEAIVHRFDPSLEIPADKSEPGVGPGGSTPVETAPEVPSGQSGGRGGPPERPAEAVVAAAFARLLNRETITLTSALTAAAAHPGAMLALYPASTEAAALAVDGGEPVETLHVTLAYLGTAADLTPEQIDGARTVAASVAGLCGPLTGEFGGVARFTSADDDGLDPVVATVDVQGLAAFRTMLCEHLAAAGVPMPSEHGYAPHLTLAYVDPDAATPVDRLDPVPATFGALSLVLGGQRTDYPLAGPADSLVAASPGPPRQRHAANSRRLADIDRNLRLRLRAAADASLRRQLEKANARVKSKLNGKPDLRATVKDVPASHYAQALGAEGLAQAGISDPSSLLVDDSGHLREQVHSALATAQRQALAVAGRIVPLSSDTSRATKAAQATARDQAWDWLSSGMDDLAGDRLFDPSPTPPDQGEHDSGFLVPEQLVRTAVAIAGGFLLAEGTQGLNPDGTPVDPSESFGGVGTGVTIAGALEESGAEIEEWEWIYGASERPFEPHVELDGITYVSHDDDQLANSYGWPETDFFYAGDHDGCDCTEAPTWVVTVPDVGADVASEEEPSATAVGP